MRHYLYAMGAIFCWASLPAATGSALQGLKPEEVMFYSFVAAAIWLVVQDMVRNRRMAVFFPPVRHSAFGVWGIFLYHYVYYHALARTPLAEGAILTTTWSFWIVVFSSVLKFRKLKPSIFLAALVGLIGAAFVIAGGKPLFFRTEDIFGYGLALCCGLIWSSFSVGLGHLAMERDPMTAFTILTALLSSLVFAVTGPHSVPPLKTLAAAVYLGFVPLGLSFFLWNRALCGGNMVVIGFLSYLTPPLAVLLVALIHGERVPSAVLTGMGLILAASIAGRISMTRAG